MLAATIAGLPDLRTEISEGAVHRRNACTGIDEKHDRVGRGDRSFGLLLHARRQAVGRGLLEPGGVDHREFEIAEAGAAFTPVAGDAGQVIDQCKTPADQSIEQG